MLKEKIEVTVKRKDAIGLKIKIVQLVKVAVSKHFVHEAFRPVTSTVLCDLLIYTKHII